MLTSSLAATQKKYLTFTEAKRLFGERAGDVSSFLFTRLEDPATGRRIDPIEPRANLGNLRVPQKAINEAQELLRSPEGYGKIAKSVSDFKQSRYASGQFVRQARETTPEAQTVEPTVRPTFGQRMTQADPLAQLGVKSAEEQTEALAPTERQRFGTRTVKGPSEIARLAELVGQKASEAAVKGAEIGQFVPGPIGTASQATIATEGQLQGGLARMPLDILEKFRLANTEDDPQKAFGYLGQASIDAGLFDTAAFALPAKLFKKRLVEKALESAEPAVKEAALKVSRMPDEELESAVKSFGPEQKPGLFGQERKAVEPVSKVPSQTGPVSPRTPLFGRQRPVEEAASREGVSVQFREPTVEAPGVEFRPSRGTRAQTPQAGEGASASQPTQARRLFQAPQPEPPRAAGRATEGPRASQEAAPQSKGTPDPDDLLASPKLEDIARVRRSLGLPAYTKDKRPWDKVVESVVSKQLHTKAEGIAEDVLAKGRLFNEEETVAAGIASRNLQNKLNRLHAENAKFLTEGNKAEADLTQKLIDQAQERADKVNLALWQSRSRTGGTLNIGKIALPDTYDSSSLRAKGLGKKNKDRPDIVPLTKEESSKIDGLSRDVKKAEADYQDAEAKWVKARVTAALNGLDKPGARRFGQTVRIDRGRFSDDAAEAAMKRLTKRSGFGPKRTTRGAANLPFDDAEALVTVLGNKIARGARNTDQLIQEAKAIVAGLDDIEGAEAVQEAISRVVRDKSVGSSIDPDLFIKGEWGVMDSEIGATREQLKGMAQEMRDRFYDPGVMLDRVEEMEKQLDRLDQFIKKGDRKQADQVREELAKLGREFNKGRAEGEEFLLSGDWAVMDKSVADARRRWEAMMGEADAYIESLTPTGFIEATRAFFRALGFTNPINRVFDVANNQLRVASEGAGKVADPAIERLLFPRATKERAMTTALPSLRRGREAAQGYWQTVGERIVRQARTGDSRLARKIGAPRAVNTAANFAEGSKARAAAKGFDALTNQLNRLPGYTDITASQWVENVTLREMVDNEAKFIAKRDGLDTAQVALLKRDMVANVDGKYDHLYSAAIEEANRTVFTHESWIDRVLGPLEKGLGSSGMLAFDTFVTRYPRIFAKIADYATDFVAGVPKAGVKALQSASKAKAAKLAGELYQMSPAEQRLITQTFRRNLQGAGIVGLAYYSVEKGLEAGKLDPNKRYIDHGDLENLGGPFALWLTAHDHFLLQKWVKEGKVTEKQAQKIAYQTWVNLVANQPVLGESERALGALIKGEGIEKYIGGKLSSTLFPGLMREAARRTDDVRLRETKDDSSLQTILNEFKKNIPVVRQTLPEKGRPKSTGRLFAR